MGQNNQTTERGDLQGQQNGKGEQQSGKQQSGQTGRDIDAQKPGDLIQSRDAK